MASHGVKYKSYTEPYLDSFCPFGDIIVSMLATIAAQDLIKVSENTKVAPAKSADVVEQVRRLKAGGASSGAIAWALKMSPNTVATYLVG